MTSTHTTAPYRRTRAGWHVGDPEPDWSIGGQCGQCGQTVADLFAHDCPADSRGMRPAGVQLHRSDSQDHAAGGGPGHGRRQTDPVTDAQRSFLVRLYREAGFDADDARQLADAVTDKRAASREIDRLKTEAGARPEPEREHAPCRPNRFAADCRDCGGYVPAEQGQLCRENGRWVVTHQDGQCKPAEAHTGGSLTALADVPAGHYAIDSTGRNDLAFYRVDRPTEGDYAGRVFVKLVVGGHPDRNVRRDHVAGILERIAADPDAAARYGRELGRCCRCNRHLTDEASRAAGIGPECAQHV